MDTATQSKYNAQMEAAAAHYAEANASFERSDTDGALTQWANTVMGRKAELQAQIEADGGTAEFRALFNLDGTVASTHLGSGQYGPYYVLNDEAAARFGKRFVSPSAAQKDERRRANNRAKGFTEGLIRVKAYADTWAPEGARGLSGATSVTVIVKPDVAALKAGEFTVVTTEA